MQSHHVRARRSAEHFPRNEHLAWKIAEVAADPVEVPERSSTVSGLTSWRNKGFDR
jgi:2-methylcitrate dehydratase